MLKIEIQTEHKQTYTSVIDAQQLEKLVVSAVAEQVEVNLKSQQVTHAVYYDRDDYGGMVARVTITVDKAPTVAQG